MTAPKPTALKIVKKPAIIPSGLPPLGNPEDATLRDIVLRGTPSDIFYRAVNQELIGKLAHDIGPAIVPHAENFKNMVATILLETARRTPGQGQEANYERCLSYTIGMFNSFRKPTQLAILENLWRSCYKRVSPSTVASAMVDGELTTQGGKSLPSSLRPVAPVGNDPNNQPFYVQLAAGPEPRAWQKWQIGFRIDGGKSTKNNRDDLERVRLAGTQPLQKNPDLAVKVAKKYYHEHFCSITRDLYIGYQNRDLYNESGTCVARSLLGATAFPERTTVNGADRDLEFQYLFAFDCRGAHGVDTEAIQVQMGNNSLWRPGEKAFAGLDAGRVLGWTKLVKCGQPKNPKGGSVSTGWSFMLPEPKWNWIKNPGGERAKWLTEELAAWTANKQYNVMFLYDFQTN